MPDSQFLKQVLMGRNILKLGIGVITHARNTRFVKKNDMNLLSEGNDLLMVKHAVILNPIEEKDVLFKGLDEANKQR